MFFIYLSLIFFHKRLLDDDDDDDDNYKDGDDNDVDNDDDEDDCLVDSVSCSQSHINSLRSYCSHVLPFMAICSRSD